MALIGATVFWLRNRDILSDLYDYSSMIAAVGKVEAGLKPYADFRSTMQSACYVLPDLVEQVFGHNYLGLTWGGLLLSLGGALALFVLLRGNCGTLPAAAITAAVTWAGFAQHVIIFYNPLGLLCLAIVVFGLARPPGARSWRDPRTWLVLGALVVGGANKINFQALTLGLGGLLILRAGVTGDFSWKRVFGWWFILLGFGVILPIALELWWTGATPREWYFNVIGLAEARVDLVQLILSPQAYLAPTYTLHRHVLLRPMHTIGLAVLLVVAAMAWRRISRRIAGDGNPGRQRVFPLRAVLVLTVLAAGAGGVLLTITNIEIITLTSSGLLVGAVAIAISFGIARRYATQWILGAAATLWIVVGGYAAWTGSRVLFGRASTDRAPFVRLVNAPASLRYLEGVRLDAGLHESLLLTAGELERLEAARGDLAHVLFGPTLEWMERDHPESILRGMPIWYDLGTSLQTTDTPWLIDNLQDKSIEHILVHPDWENWPRSFRHWLRENFRVTPLGRVVKHYELHAKPGMDRTIMTLADNNPFALLDRAANQIHVRTTRGLGDHIVTFESSPWGEFFGTTGNWTWWWGGPTRIVEGTFVAVAPPRTRDTVPLTWRIIADPDGQAVELASGRFNLSPGQTTVRAPFRVEPNGRALAFKIEMANDPAKTVTAGWRDMRILEVGEVTGESVPPGLRIDKPAHEFTLPDGTVVWQRIGSALRSNHPPAGFPLPFEAWKKDAGSPGTWQVTLDTTPYSNPGGVAPIVMLVWCKSTRFEILTQEVAPLKSGPHTLTGWIPEPGGWMGVIVRPVERDKPLDRSPRLLRWSQSNH